MKRHFTFLFLFIAFLLVTQNIYAQRIYLKAYDNNDAVIQGTSDVPSPNPSQKLIEILSVSTGVSCANCTLANPNGKRLAQDISFLISNGPEVTAFREMLTSGQAATRLYFIFTKPGNDTVKNTHDTYIIALGYCRVDAIQESFGGEPSTISISLQYDGAAYYYRKTDTNGNVPVTPTSVTTWNFVNDNPTLNEHTTLLQLPAGY